jgi:hypothetical protein
MINIFNGDLLANIGQNKRIIIAHVVNDAGGFGAGFAKALTNWNHVIRDNYKELFTNGHIQLGTTHYLHLDDSNILIAHMVAQNAYAHWKSNPVALRYHHLAQCLNDVGNTAKNDGYQIWMPYMIGCGLAGGDWGQVYLMIKDILVNKYAVNVTLWRYNG